MKSIVEEIHISGVAYNLLKAYYYITAMELKGECDFSSAEWARVNIHNALTELGLDVVCGTGDTFGSWDNTNISISSVNEWVDEQVKMTMDRVYKKYDVEAYLIEGK